MRYLQADTERQELMVLPGQRNWSDMKSERHYEYHVATLRQFEGPFTVVVHADQVPYSALLHVPLFVRIAQYARANCKNKLKKIIVFNPSTVTRMLHVLLTPVTPKAVLEKITFVVENKKLE